MAAGKKKKKKPPKRWTGKPASVWAIKGARVAKNLAWMPDEVVLHLAGDWRTKLLDVCGWGTTVGGAHDTWPRDHIEANMDRIVDIWAEDFGRGWRLEVRDE